jgi:DNA primase
MFIDFKELKRTVTIEQAAKLLNSQLRGACPGCSNEDERILVLTPSRGLFYCFDAKVGGDCLALVQHITGLEVQDAAQFLAPKGATVPQKTEGRKQPASKEFDPAAFAQKLSYSDEVSELGISEEDATRLQIGFTRGKVYFPIRNDDGSISGFVGFADGQLKMPPQWLRTNVVKLKRA